MSQISIENDKCDPEPEDKDDDCKCKEYTIILNFH